MSKKPIVNYPFLYVNGLNVTWASNTTLTISAGICRDSTNIYDITLAAATTLNAAVNGKNGLDTGTFAASKCYAIFTISDSSGFSAPATLMSLSSTAPVLPTGYDIFRRTGWAFSDGSTHFLLSYNSGNGSTKEYVFDEPVSALSGGTSATFAAVALTEKVPAIDNLLVKLQLSFTPNAANDTAYLRAGGSSATNGMVMSASVAAKANSQSAQVVAKLVTTAPTIEYKVTASGSLTATILSFVDSI